MAEVGSKLIFENERVKVWEFTLAPGETIAAHRHDHDYFFYPIEGGTLEVMRQTGIVQATLDPGKSIPARSITAARATRMPPAISARGAITRSWSS